MVRLDTPSPLGSSGIIGLAGKSRQNPDNKRLRGQNLDSKGLTAAVVRADQTAFALAMMGLFFVGRKVRCHNGAVDFVQRDEADSSLTLAGFTGCEWLGMTRLK